MKRVLAIILALLFVLTTFAACTSGSGSSSSAAEPSKSESSKAESSTSASSESEPEPDEPTVEPWDVPVFFQKDPEDMLWMHDTSPITFQLYYNEPDDHENWTWDDSRIRQHITERTGVRIEYTFAPDTEGTRLNLMLAGGEKLPDYIARVWGNSTYMRDMIEGEFIIPMEDLINEYCPEMWDMLGEATPYYNLWTDGKMWSLPWEMRQMTLNNPYAVGGNGNILVRGDILEDLGYDFKSFKTIDDLKEILTKFMEVKDQYPEVVYPLYLTSANTNWLACFAGRGNFGAYNYDKETEEIKYWFETDEGREGLLLFNEFYRNGWLNPECFVTTTSFDDSLRAGSMFIAMKGNTYEYSVTNPDLAKNVEGAWYTIILPPCKEGTEDIAWHSNVGFSGGGRGLPCISITQDCINPERAVAWLEWLTSEEGQVTTYMGIQDVDWTLDTDENGVYFPRPIGEAAAAKAEGLDTLARLGIMDYMHMWLSRDPRMDNLFDYHQVVDARKGDGNLEQWQINAEECKAFWKTMLGTYSETLAGSVNIPQDSDQYVLRANINEVIKGMIAPVITANSQAEAEANLDNLIKEVYAAGAGDLFDWIRPQVKQVIDDLAGFGIYYD